MAPIPLATGAPYTRLVDRCGLAVARLSETRWVDFKQDEPWEVLKMKIVRAALAMSNLRDGGILVVGVAESGTTWKPTGISAAHLKTYDPDEIADVINKYASPAIEVTIALVRIDGKDFLVFEFEEFAEYPVICQRANDDEGLRRGAMYHRPRGRPRSEAVASEADMREILDLAGIKIARRFVEQGLESGLQFPKPAMPYPADDASFDDEIEDLA